MTNNKPTEILFFPSREVRVVPKGWPHPQSADEPVPVLFEDMPGVEGLTAEQTEIAAYETSTYGTPLSPFFPNTPQGRLQLIEYCAENCTTWGYEKAGGEAWAAILFGKGAVVDKDGVVIANDN